MTVARMTSASRRGTVILLLIGWLIALALPVGDHVGTSAGTVYGFTVLLLGWMATLALLPAWFANPLFLWICWLLWSDRPPTRRWALVRGSALVLLGLSALLWKSASYVMPDQVTQYRIGFWVWMAVMLAAGAAAIADARRSLNNAYPTHNIPKIG